MMENTPKDERPIEPARPLKLRRVGTRYMLVENLPDRADLTYVYTLNATAAWLWQTVCERPATPSCLVTLFADHFGIDAERAAADVTAQLDEWRDMGLIRPQQPSVQK